MGIGEIHSSWTTALSGVSQGSGLGPLLLKHFINDRDDEIFVSL